LAAYEYDGFFAAMDTFKDKQQLDDLHEGGRPPWEVWRERSCEAEKPDDGGGKGALARVPLSDRRT